MRNLTVSPFIPAIQPTLSQSADAARLPSRLKDQSQEEMRGFMPTYIRIAYAQPRSVFPEELSAVSTFLIIGLIQIAFAVLAGGQWASFGEQSLW